MNLFKPKEPFLTSEVRVTKLNTETATIQKLYVKEGAHVQPGQKLGKIVAEKGNFFYSPNYGKVTEIKANEGDQVTEGDLLVVIDSFDGGSLKGKLKKTWNAIASIILGLGIFVILFFTGMKLLETPKRSYWGKYTKPLNPEKEALPPLNPNVKKAGIPKDEVSRGRTNQRYYSKLGIIEFDEYGDFWEGREQLENITSLIGQSDYSNEPPVVVFIHGWNNDATVGTNDLFRFSEFLFELDEKQREGLSEEDSKKIGAPVGIYIGWRGKSTKDVISSKDVAKYFSFPGRRIATDRVASFALMSCLWEIRHAVNQNQFPQRVILIGHSFGGRILEQVSGPSVVNYHNSVLRPYFQQNKDYLKETDYLKSHDYYKKILDTFPELQFAEGPENYNRQQSALQTLESAGNLLFSSSSHSSLTSTSQIQKLELIKKAILDRSELGDDRWKMRKLIDRGIKLTNQRNRFLMGDLILLINPATEGLHARQIKLATSTWPIQEPPAIISITSDSDWATGLVWTGGKILEKSISPFVPIHSSRKYLTHKGTDKKGYESQSGFVEHTSGHDERVLSGMLNLEDGELVFDKVLADPKGYAYSDTKRPGSKVPEYKLPMGGYWSFRVPHELLEGHMGKPKDGVSTIFHEETRELLLKLIHETDIEHFGQQNWYQELLLANQKKIEVENERNEKWLSDTLERETALENTYDQIFKSRTEATRDDEESDLETEDVEAPN